MTPPCYPTLLRTSGCRPIQAASPLRLGTYRLPSVVCKGFPNPRAVAACERSPEGPFPCYSGAAGRTCRKSRFGDFFFLGVFVP